MNSKITAALDRLKAKGKTYFTSGDVLEEIDNVPNTTGKKKHVGRLINELKQEREDIELWNSGSKHNRWRLK